MAAENAARGKHPEKIGPQFFARKIFFPSQIYFWVTKVMKNFNCKIDDGVDLRLRLYAIHLGVTKAEAGFRALRDGIPRWVMTLPPTDALRMARPDPEDPDRTMNSVCLEALLQEI